MGKVMEGYSTPKDIRRMIETVMKEERYCIAIAHYNKDEEIDVDCYGMGIDVKEFGKAFIE